ncbi:OmpA family protein [Duganella sp. FT50W]|uniref:OmpA family protein n=1 Tax=Duganella lactea TaxID=2692173 RepID=A0A6L8MG54_9BURK|nr:OmpA family protein [Duganella lactea]MYM81379.1 OmpA family protein [Duganella lactea]
MKAAHTQSVAGLLPARFAVKFLTVAVCTTLISACATDPRTGQPSFKETFASDDPCANNARNIGIFAGALAGVILANQVQHSDRARIVGALAGATIGGLIGKDMDDRRCALSKIAKQYDLQLQTSTVSASGQVIADSSLKNNPNAEAIQKSAVGMVVEVRDQPGRGGHFETNSDQLTEQAQRYFSAIADSYNTRLRANNIADPKEKADYIDQVSKRKILLIGHTDDTGSSRLNADLSERRARAVAAYMEKRGIAQESLYFQGAGEAYPIADNNTEGGRAQNRRVEIVEVADAEAFNRFLAERKPRYEFYRPGETQAAPVMAAASVAAPATTKRQAGKQAASKPGGKAAPASTPSPSASTAAVASGSTPAPANGIDFGGRPMMASGAADIGQMVARNRTGFSLISNAYADEPPVIADCSRDRPRAAHGVKSLSDGKTYRTAEYLPGLYGKTWADQVNGHLVVLNKVAVLSGDGAAANLPEFKVYTNYNPARSATATPALSLTPEVNTYLGDRGLLYRLFLNGKGGLSCVDVVFSADGGTAARKGSLVYWHNARLMSADFKPTINQK